MRKRHAWGTAGIVGLAFVVACVTVNIYFPAAAAEKAADKIIDEVWQLKQPNGGDAAKPAPKGEDKP